MNFNFISSTVAVAALALPAGGAGSAISVTRARYLMGTVCRVTVPAGPEAEQAAAAAFEEIARVERLLSTWRPDTPLARLNAAAPGRPVEVPRELFDLLRDALSWSRRTDGAFNPLVGSMVDAWQLRGAGRRPTAAELVAAVAGSRPDGIALDEAALTVTRLAAGALFEEGAFGKGYALDRALAVLRGRGSNSAWIDFGGQVGLYGLRDGPIEIAIAHPLSRSRAALSLHLGAGSLSTSSASGHTFEAGGRRFSHLLDPRSGEALPPRGSMSIVEASGLEADVLSTALYVMGPSVALAWARANGVAALALVPAADGRFCLRLSPAARQRVGDLRILDDGIRLQEGD